MNRRKFMQSAALAAGGLWVFGGDIVLGQVPWEEEEETVRLLDAEGFEVDSRKLLEQGTFTGSPGIAFDAAGKLWAIWISVRNGEEMLHAVSYDGSDWTPETRLSDKSTGVLHPNVVRHGDGVAAAWTQRTADGKWQILVKSLTSGAATKRLYISADSIAPLWHPRLRSDDQGALWLVWEEKVGARFRIRARRISDGEGAATIDVSQADDRDCTRPTLALDSKGTPWIAWDQMDAPGGPQIYLASVAVNPARDSYLAGRPLRVTHHPAANIAPSIAIDGKDRVWIAFQSNRRTEDTWDIPRWIYIRCVKGEKIYEPAAPMVALNLDKEGTDQSFEFPRLFIAPNGSVVVTGRPSHNFCIQQYQDKAWSPLYRVPVDGWGGRGQFLEGAFDEQGDFWIARRDLNANIIHRVKGLNGEAKEPELKEVKIPEKPAALTNIERQNRWAAIEETVGLEAPLNLYYGDIHGHTFMSDGLNDVDEYFFIRRDYYNDDFAGLTDHDTFVGKSLMPSQWELQKVITEHFNEPGRFATLFAQEWTTARYPNGGGHKCMYSTDPAFTHYNNAIEPWKDTKKLYAELKKVGAIIVPHHTGWTGTDWENFDPEVQTLGEIVSNHGVFEHMGNEPIPHRGGFAGMFLQDALAMGHRFGFIGSSDAHGLIWHHRAGWKRDSFRGGLACVLAPELTREAVFDALKNRRTFATTGIKPYLDFRVNNHLMGSEFDLEGSEVEIHLRVRARNRIRWVTIIKNNKEWNKYGGEGFETRFTMKDSEVGEGTSWYYVRVEFLGPEMAWSSPIWVTRTA